MRHGTILVVRVKLGSPISCLYCTHYGTLIDAKLFVVTQLSSDKVWVLNYGPRSSSSIQSIFYNLAEGALCDVIFRIVS